MPLRAISDTGDVHAFALDAVQWADLKGSYKQLNLRMPCCYVPAVPKTSTLGNFFFAHARRGECITAPESAEHLYCKSLVARAALDAGWAVTTERPGVTPDGEEWVADVFCEKGKAKLALEVQMSPQTHDETARRQERYKASGVRGAWFYGSKAYKGWSVSEEATPAFTLTPVIVGQVPAVHGFGVSLTEFVTGMLQKRLVWIVPEYNSPDYVEFLVDSCWACKKPVKQVYACIDGQDALEGEVLTIDTVHEGRWHEPTYTVSSLSSALADAQKVVSNDELAALGLNLIAKQNVSQGKATKAPFYCNLCLHCRAPQNNFHLSEKLQAALARDDEGPRDIGPESCGSSFGGEFGVGLAAVARMRKGRGRWEFKVPAVWPGVAAQ